MTTPPDAPGSGYGVVSGQLRDLGGKFVGYSNTVTTSAGQLSGTVVTGLQTGRCCREAGDAMKAESDVLDHNLRDFGTQCGQVTENLGATAANYDRAEQGNTATVTASGLGAG
jgi:hypothetical protein